MDAAWDVNFTVWLLRQTKRELSVVRCAPLAYAGSVRSLSLEEGGGAGLLRCRVEWWDRNTAPWITA